MKNNSGVQAHHAAWAGATNDAGLIGTAALTPFPKGGSRPPPVWPGVALRAARNEDLPFLLRLYGETRALELSGAPWPESMKRAFIADQFSLQHQHYLARNPRADFWLVERTEPGRPSTPIGRFYLDRGGREWKCVELGLLSEARGAGVGGGLLRATQAAASKASAEALILHVEKTNHDARRLYERLGFEDAPSLYPSHWLMRWTPAARPGLGA